MNKEGRLPYLVDSKSFWGTAFKDLQCYRAAEFSVMLLEREIPMSPGEAVPSQLYTGEQISLTTLL